MDSRTMRLVKMFSLLSWVLIPGYWALSGPNEVHGDVGASLSVKCCYDKDYENQSKYWCKFKTFLKVFSELYCAVLIRSELDKKVEDSRISIQDSKKTLCFKVNMNNLTLKDAGLYQCGITHRIFPDSTHNIKVIIYQDPEEESTITEQPEKISNTEQDERLSSTKTSDPGRIAEDTDESSSSPIPTE
ncbi:CMRF35-like molecule 6 [Anolis carolinensis]|nr:PREDICTED: CMRF35-like molecule 6 [Anolis carolinensis]|eukprot:XP_008102701.1 PREDICTED: CMRF35-like molecule 6 [Anolis carolinensis]